MKVFKFYSEDYYYAVAAETEQKANDYLFDYVGIMPIDEVIEIPESQWDRKMIEMYEDNDIEKERFLVSIRDEICGEEPQIVYTNDRSLIG